jgi:hypothetical protein
VDAQFPVPGEDTRFGGTEYGVWVVVGAEVRQAPTPPAPTTPSIVGGVVFGAAGIYRITNVTTGVVTETQVYPPFNAADYGLPGQNVTFEPMRFSSDGPDIVLGAATQIMVSAVGTLARSGATITLTPATWDTGSVTVTRTKTIAGVTTALVGTTFDVGNNETYSVSEVAAKSGFIDSAPAVTATGRRPAASPIYAGGKTQNWRNTVANETVSLTNLSGGIITAPEEGDLVVVSIARASNVSNAVTLVTSGYTTVFSLYANDTSDTNHLVAYKRMTATPDTDIVISAAADVQENQSITVQVFRDVNIATPLDVAAASATGANSGTPVAPAITPVTSGAAISVMAATHAIAAATFSIPIANALYLRNDTGTYRITVGAGTATWSSGTYTPSTWGGSASTAASWTAVTLALRPAA